MGSRKVFEVVTKWGAMNHLLHTPKLTAWPKNPLHYSQQTPLLITIVSIRLWGHTIYSGRAAIRTLYKMTYTYPL